MGAGGCLTKLIFCSNFNLNAVCQFRVFHLDLTDSIESSSECLKGGTMKSRSITSRNLLGGFLGGTLGILAFWLINWLLPIGCLGGVVLGFWYQEIWVALAKDFRKTQVRWNHFRDNTLLVPRFQLKINLSGFKEELMTGGAFFIYYAIRWSIAAIRGGIAAARFIKVAVKWPFKERLNGVILLNFTAMVIFCCLIIYLAALQFMMWGYNSTDDGVSFIIVTCFGLAFPILGTVLPTLINDETHQTITLPRDLAIYDRFGLMGLLTSKLIALIKSFGLFIAFEILALLYLAIGAVTVSFFMAAPVAVAMLSLRVLWKFATSKNHWVCFFTTLAVTLTSALLTRQYLQGAGLWIIALATGCFAGVLSEGARRLVASILKTQPKAIAWAQRSLEDPIEALLIPLWGKYSRLNKYAYKWVPMPEGFQV